jgi:hypothetical protein
LLEGTLLLVKLLAIRTHKLRLLLGLGKEPGGGLLGELGPVNGGLLEGWLLLEGLLLLRHSAEVD